MQSLGQYRLIIVRLGFTSRRSNREESRKRQCFGFLQHQLRCNDHIAETGFCWQRARALKAVNERHKEAKLNATVQRYEQVGFPLVFVAGT